MYIYFTAVTQRDYLKQTYGGSDITHQGRSNQVVAIGYDIKFTIPKFKVLH